jgi:rRNA maturation RNase YbeY
MGKIKKLLKEPSRSFADISFNKRRGAKLFGVQLAYDLVSYLTHVARVESHTIGSLSYTFCTDEQLLQINQEHLGHNWHTDVITFDVSFDSSVHGDVYISSDRVLANSTELGKPVQEELMRVIVHGLLHLCGHNDKTNVEQRKIRKLEDRYLADLPRFHVKNHRK